MATKSITESIPFIQKITLEESNKKHTYLIPPEILSNIFFYGDAKDLVKWSSVCKHWKNLCYSHDRWKAILFRAFPKWENTCNFMVLDKTDYRQIYINQYRTKLYKNYGKLLFRLKTRILIESAKEIVRCAVYGDHLIAITPTSIQSWDIKSKTLHKEVTHGVPHP
jgi:hypothetical protein